MPQDNNPPTIEFGNKSKRLKKMHKSSQVENQFKSVLTSMSQDQKQKIKCDMGLICEIIREMYQQHPESDLQEIKRLTVQVLKESVGLSGDEIKCMESQINYLIEHHKIKKIPKWRQALKKLGNVLVWLVS